MAEPKVPNRAPPHGKVGRGDLLEAVFGQALVHRLDGIELFECDPLWPVRSRHQPPVSDDPLAGNLSTVLSTMQQRDGIERGAKHEHADLGLQRLVKRRSFSIAILKRMLAGDPFGEMAERDDASVGMVASDRTWPRAKDLVQHTMIAGRTCDPLVEHGNLSVVGVFVEGLTIDVRDNRPCRANCVEQRLDNDVGATGNRPIDLTLACTMMRSPVATPNRPRLSLNDESSRWHMCESPIRLGNGEQAHGGLIGSYGIVDPGEVQNPTIVLALLPKYGGEVLASDTAAFLVEGTARTMNAIIRFPSKEAALGLYNDPAYQEAKRIRQASTRNISMVVVEEFQAGATPR